MNDLREKTIKGLGWAAVEKWLAQALNLIVFLLLVRLLTPEDFGLVAMASVFISFIQVFVDQGFTAAIVQRPHIDDELLDTAFWVNISLGMLFTIIGILFSGIVASFFSEPQLKSVVAWLSLTFIFSALSSTQQGILRRNLDFKSLATRTFFARLIGGVVGILFAFWGWGVWSLVVQMLVGSFIGVITLWRVSNWRPHFQFSKHNAQELFNFGIFVTGNKMLSFLDLRVDDLLIGYFLGAITLGYYTIAYNLLLRLVDAIGGITNSVSTSAFSRLQGDPDQLLNTFYKASRLTAIIVIPLFLAVLVMSPELIPLLFGLNWEPSIIIMQILAPVGIALSLLSYFGNVVTAIGKPRKVFQVRVYTSVSRVIGFAVAVAFGINMVAATFTLTTFIIAIPLYIIMVNRFTDFHITKYLSEIILPLASSLIMIFIILLMKRIFVIEHLLISIIVYSIVGGGIYLLCIYLIRPAYIHELLKIGFTIVPVSRFNRKNILSQVDKR